MSEFQFRTSQKLAITFRNVEQAHRQYPPFHYEGTANADEGRIYYEVNLYPQIEPYDHSVLLNSMIKVEFDGTSVPMALKSFLINLKENVEAVLFQVSKGIPWAWQKLSGLEGGVSRIEFRDGHFVFFLSFSTQSSFQTSLHLSPIWEQVIDEVEERFPGARPWSQLITEVNNRVR
jgi:hypothetical protein